MIIDLQSNITPNFKWYEALFLASWNIYCFPNTEENRLNIISTCEKLEEVRAILKSSIIITSFYRPPTYNQSINGSLNSLHMRGLAVDFVPSAMDVQIAKEKIMPHLERLNIRMENNGKGRWVHIDLGKVLKGGSRYFLP